MAILLVGLATAARASAASPSAPPFSAHGSAQQVYVTGVAPNAQMSLLANNTATH